MELFKNLRYPRRLFMTIMTVLYVDDEKFLLEIGKLFLERYGFVVETVESTDEAFELMKCKSYDAIVSDYQMPGMNGIEFLVKVRLLYGRIPFILFTGRGREEVVIQAIDNGVDYYLQKGGDPESQFAELAHKIGLAISRKRAKERIKQQANAMEASIDGMAILDVDQNYVYVNRAHIEIYGYDNGDELIGQSWKTLYDLDELERFEVEIIPELRKKGFFQGRAIGKKKDGTKFYQGLSLTVLENGGLICVVRDITNQMKMEEKLREREERYLQFFKTSVDCIFITSPSGKFIDFNDLMMESFGYTDWRKLMKVNVLSLYAFPEDRAVHIDFIVKSGGHLKEFPVKMRHIDGSIIETLITTTITRNADGSIKEFVGFIRMVKNDLWNMLIQ